MKDKGNEGVLRFPLLKFILSVCLRKSFCLGHLNCQTCIVERRGEPFAKPPGRAVYERRRCQKGCAKRSVGSAHQCFFHDVKVVLRVDPEDPCASEMSVAVLEV